jgi:hypothetical protein
MHRANPVVILALSLGYRWEPSAPGLVPLLTNCPPGQHWCCACGQWMARRACVLESGACRRCLNTRQWRKRHQMSHTEE